MINVVHEVEAAMTRIRPHSRRTYLEPSPVLQCADRSEGVVRRKSTAHRMRLRQSAGAVNKVMMWLS
jgi:hypothetical protein